jgi:hypothetical protein
LEASFLADYVTRNNDNIVTMIAGHPPFAIRGACLIARHEQRDYFGRFASGPTLSAYNCPLNYQ